MPEHELVYVSGGRQRQNRALAKGLQRVPSAQRYFHASLCLSLPRKRAQRPSEHRFFLIHIERLFRGRLKHRFSLIQPRLLFGGHLSFTIFLLLSGLLFVGAGQFIRFKFGCKKSYSVFRKVGTSSNPPSLLHHETITPKSIRVIRKLTSSAESGV